MAPHMSLFDLAVTMLENGRKLFDKSHLFIIERSRVKEKYDYREWNTL